jgi:hypothetical protein
VRLLPARPRQVRFAVTDAGAGVDPKSIGLRIDGSLHRFTLVRGVLTGRGVAPGAHTVRLVVSDFQEPKNMEDVGPVLPNTRTVSVRVRVP